MICINAESWIESLLRENTWKLVLDYHIQLYTKVICGEGFLYKASLLKMDLVKEYKVKEYFVNN